MKKVCIIGSGPTCQGILEGINNLAEEHIRDYEVIILEISNTPFTGFAYNKNGRAEHKLTSDAGTFTTYEYSFKDWLSEPQNVAQCISLIEEQKLSKNTKDNEIKKLQEIQQPSNFAKYLPPRCLCGLYFSDMTNKTINELRQKGVKVDIITNCKAEHINKKDGYFEVITNTGENIACSDLALATGIVPSEYKVLDGFSYVYDSSLFDEIVKYIDENKNNPNCKIQLLGALASGNDAKQTIIEALKYCKEKEIVEKDFIIEIDTLSTTGVLSHVNILPLERNNKYLTAQNIIPLIEKKESVALAFNELFQKEVSSILDEEHIQQQMHESGYCSLLENQQRGIKGGGNPVLQMPSYQNLLQAILTNKDCDSIQRMLSELALNDEISYRIYMTPLIKALPLIYELLEQYKYRDDLKEPKQFNLKELHSTIISLTGAVHPTVAQKIYHHPYLIHKNLNANELDSNPKILKIDCRTVSRCNKQPLIDQIKKQEMVDKKGFSVSPHFINVSNAASNRYSTIAHLVGKQNVRNLLSGVPNQWHFYSEKNFAGLNTASQK